MVSYDILEHMALEEFVWRIQGRFRWRLSSPEGWFHVSLSFGFECHGFCIVPSSSIAGLVRFVCVNGINVDAQPDH